MSDSTNNKAAILEYMIPAIIIGYFALINISIIGKLLYAFFTILAQAMTATTLGLFLMLALTVLLLNHITNKVRQTIDIVPVETNPADSRTFSKDNQHETTHQAPHGTIDSLAVNAITDPDNQPEHVELALNQDIPIIIEGTASSIDNIDANNLLMESYCCDLNNNTTTETGGIPVANINATPLLMESHHDPANTGQEVINIPNNNRYTPLVEIDQNRMHAKTSIPNHPFYMPLARTVSTAG